MKKGRKLGLVLVSVLLFAGFAAAAPPTLEEGDADIWMNDASQDKTLNAELVCDDGKEIKSAAIRNVYGKVIKEYDVSGSEYSAAYNFSEHSNPLGEYSVEYQCGSSTKYFRKSFEVNRLKTEVTAPDSGAPVYLGTSDTVNVKLSSVVGTLDASELNQVSRVNVYRKGNRDPLGSSSTKNGGNVSVLVNVRKSLLDSGVRIAEGVTLEAIVRMQDPQTTAIWREKATQTVTLKRWKVDTSYSPAQRLSASEFSKLNLTVRLMRNGEPVTGLEPRHFFMDGEDWDPSGNTGDYEWFSGGFQKVSGNLGVYNLKLEKMPPFDETKDYSLSIFFDTDGDDTEASNYGDKLKIGTVYVEKKFTFEGRVSDSDSRAVQTMFKLQSDKYVEQFSTNARGFFSRRVMPGTYGMTVNFPKGSLRLNGVELGRGYSGNVNYQYYENPGKVQGVNLKGIDPINMMTVSFGHPFDSGTASMQYDPAETEDPMNVDVYECQRWNFWGESCISGWEKISEEDVTLPPTQWKAKFPVTPVQTSEYGDTKQVLYSAYVVGTNSGLALDRIGLESYRVPTGKSFKIKGRVVTKGQPVKNADVNLVLMDGSQVVKSASTSSGPEGSFSTSMEAPAEPGNYSVRAEISKGSYRPVSKTLDNQITVYREKSMTMKLPESFKISTGETLEKTVTVKNDGQADFENVKLSVAESELDISFSDKQFSLGKGDKKQVQISVTVPEGFCDPSCVKYPTSEIQLKADGFSKKFDLGVAISQASSASSSQTDSSSRSGGNTSSSPLPVAATGQFLASQSATNIALGLITVFSLALASAVRKKKGEDGSDRDSRNVNLQRPKVEPAGGSDSDVDEIAGNMDDSNDVDAVARAMAGEEQQEDEEDIDALAEAMEEAEENSKDEGPEETDLEDHVDTDPEESDDNPDLSCSTCGDEFDTESGLKLHRQAFH